jgi:hypothetical protein
MEIDHKHNYKFFYEVLLVSYRIQMWPLCESSRLCPTKYNLDKISLISASTKENSNN